MRALARCGCAPGHACGCAGGATATRSRPPSDLDDALAAAVALRASGATAQARMLQRQPEGGAATIDGPRCPAGLIRLGSRGSGVSDLQDRLNRAGTSPPLEVDGIFGKLTRRAVVAFQASSELSADGIVGPLTCSKLDDAAPEPPPLPGPIDGGDDGPLFCPSEQQIESALAVGPTAVRPSSEVSAFAPPTFGSASALAPARTPPAPRHLGIQGAVKAFHAKVDVAGLATDRNVSQHGQFFFEDEMHGLINAELTRIRVADGGDADVRAFVSDGRGALRAVGTRDTDPNTGLTVSQLMARMSVRATRTKKTELKAAMFALLARHGPGVILEVAWWGVINKTERMPDLTPFRSIDTLKALDDHAKSACGSHVSRVMERLAGKKGLAGTGPSGPPFHSVMLGATATRDRRPLPGKGGTRMLGDVLVQVNLDAAVTELKRALDAGHVVHARVLSGVGAGLGEAPPEPASTPTTVAVGEEHSVLIIGFDANTFVFNDPDATVSSSPEPGFGLLTYDAPASRLSTARSAADLAVDTDGDHSRGEHRYQVIRLASA